MHSYCGLCSDRHANIYESRSITDVVQHIIIIVYIDRYVIMLLQLSW